MAQCSFNSGNVTGWWLDRILLTHASKMTQFNLSVRKRYQSYWINMQYSYKMKNIVGYYL